MTYVQRVPQLPVPQLSGKTLAFLLVVSLHVVLVGLIVNNLREINLPVATDPNPVTLLPSTAPPPEKERVLLPGPVVDSFDFVPAEPTLPIEEVPQDAVEPVDGAPVEPDTRSGSGAVAVPPTRVLPRQDPAHPLGRPAYPPMSIRLGETGVVELDVCTDAAGRTTDVRIRSSSGFRRLDAAAVAHLRRPSVRLLPGMENGAPSPMCTDLRMRFDFEPN